MKEGGKANKTLEFPFLICTISYLGGERFAGEEAVWFYDEPVWSMNYVGRVIGEQFNLDFLREALYHVQEEQPYRGPEIYTKGDYHYHCKVDGSFASVFRYIFLQIRLFVFILRLSEKEMSL